MSDGYGTDTAQLRTHAAHIEALRARFAAVKGASAHIAQDDQAYGVLCGWISGLLEGKHTRHDDVLAYLEENLALVADGLRRNAAGYEAVEADVSDSMKRLGSRLGG
ncbi:hypothetical protein ACFFX1_36695 [Dactylosporangium sucinum]|uniref:Excreted virulence factor EspC, type VII ESX diderm n=1 Tax=Dactylosporangium sucinum TaxID=1424081 RepID=A0A917TTU9_9ACTN|nr:hypothetical protein [Dactylosporangium sucinum]GGM37141.1 hypothetical protein GCM10007977_043200 [Dactylosporangium sucinum]